MNAFEFVQYNPAKPLQISHDHSKIIPYRACY
jgi:hypothetical protein